MKLTTFNGFELNGMMFKAELAPIRNQCDGCIFDIEMEHLCEIVPSQCSEALRVDCLDVIWKQIKNAGV